MEPRANTLTGWLYMVFEAPTAESFNANPSVGAYLRNRASAQFLRRFFDPLYDRYGVGISTSDDEVIEKPAALSALREAILEAIREVEGRPESWSETTGYELQNLQAEPGDPNVEFALREPLLAFLREARTQCEAALRNRSYLIWGGGE